MKYISFLFLLCFTLSVNAQVKISEMNTTTANPTGGWIPIVLNGSNHKYDAGVFYNKLDSLYKKAGTDSIFTLKNGVSSFAFVDNGGCCAEGPFIPQKTMAELRALTADITKYKVYYITDNGKEGLFKYAKAVDYQAGADPLDETDDGVMNLVTANNLLFRRIVDDHINAKWFGATPQTGAPYVSSVYTQTEAENFFKKFSTETPAYFNASEHYNNQNMDWFGIQCAINYCIRTNLNQKTLYIPAGNYNISRELMAYRWSQSLGQYQPVRLTIEGDADVYGSNNGTSISADHTNTFALGIQLGKGCIVKNILFSGRFYTTVLDDPNARVSDRDFYSLTADQFRNEVNSRLTASGKPACADKQNGPYSGVVIDPFGPVYPGASLAYDVDSRYYRGVVGGGGSGGIKIENLTIKYFVVGFITSPNGSLPNNECVTVNRMYVEGVKIGIAMCQEQEKTNVVKNLAANGAIHTVIAANGSSYGVQAPGQWSIEDVDVAGRVVQLISRHDDFWFPIFLKNIYAESIGQIGFLQSGSGGSMENSYFDFKATVAADPNSTTFSSYYPQWHIDGSGFTFKNCTFHYRDRDYPLSINGNFKFENCVFETVPFSPLLSQRMPAYTNCLVKDAGELGATGTRAMNATVFDRHIAYGHFTLSDMLGNLSTGNVTKFNYQGDFPHRVVGRKTFSQTLSVDNNGYAYINITQDEWNKYYQWSNIVLIRTGSDGNDFMPLGIRVGGYANGQIRVGGIRTNLTGTIQEIACMLPVVAVNPFLGDLVAGRHNEIVNIRLDKANGYGMGNLPQGKASMVGRVILFNNIPSAANTYEDYSVIWDYVPAANGNPDYFKIAHMPVYHSDATPRTYYFCNGCEKIRDNRTPNSSLHAEDVFPAGATFVNTESARTRRYRVIKNGLYQSISGESRVAEMVPEYNYNNHADARFYGQSEIYFSSVSNANSLIEARDRKKGMNVLILESGTPVEYWYKEGIADANLVKKPASVIQSGAVNAGTNSGQTKTFVLNFPATFNTTPHLVLTPRSDGSDDKVFVVNITAISASQATLTIYCVNATGWSYNLYLEWVASE